MKYLLIPLMFLVLGCGTPVVGKPSLSSRIVPWRVPGVRPAGIRAQGFRSLEEGNNMLTAIMFYTAVALGINMLLMIPTYYLCKARGVIKTLTLEDVLLRTNCVIMVISVFVAFFWELYPISGGGN